MKKDELPYVSQCAFCDQGVLRFMQCKSCEAIAAVCDECELVWGDIKRVHDDPGAPSSSSFPACPSCNNAKSDWSTLDREGVHHAGLDACVAGKSV